MPIDKQQLAEDCFTLAKEIHSIGYDHLIDQEIEEERKANLRLCKELNAKSLDSFSVYARYQEMDYEYLVRTLWDYSAQMKDHMFKLEREWSAEEIALMHEEYNKQLLTRKSRRGKIGDKKLMKKAQDKMITNLNDSTDWNTEVTLAFLMTKQQKRIKDELAKKNKK